LYFTRETGNIYNFRYIAEYIGLIGSA
jgi:hypothetical protein